MRRIAAAVGVLSLVLTPSAGAHPAFQPNFAPAGEAATIALVIPNERRAAMTALELVAPPAVDLVSAESSGGWQGTVAGRRATWTGRLLRPHGIARVVVRVRPTGEPGTTAFRVTQRFADRRAVHWPLELTVLPGRADGGGSSLRYGALGVVGVAAALALAFVLWLRRRGRGSLQES
jgi:hypothetical protein